jgi:hypothetical protein
MISSLGRAIAVAQDWRITLPLVRPMDLLAAALARKAQELSLHRIDFGDIRRDEVIAAALAGDHVKPAACVGRGRARAAEMDESGEILLLLRACGRYAGMGESCRHMAVQIHGGELDGMARDHADGEGGEPAAAIHDDVVADAGLSRLGVGRIDGLEQADGAGGGLVDRERIEAPLPAPIGACQRIAAALDLRQRGQ